MSQSLLQRNNGSPMGLGQPHKRVAEAILRPATQEGYGQPAFMPVPPSQMPAGPKGVAPMGAPAATELRGVPRGLYDAPPTPKAEAFPANAAYDQLQRAILQGQVAAPAPPASAPTPSPLDDPAYAEMLNFIQQQSMGAF